MSKASLAVLYSTEQDLAKQYHDLDKEIDTARKDNDTFALSDLKDKREQAQKQYWDARNKREQLVSAVEIASALDAATKIAIELLFGIR